MSRFCRTPVAEVHVIVADESAVATTNSAEVVVVTTSTLAVLQYPSYKAIMVLISSFTLSTFEHPLLTHEEMYEEADEAKSALQ
jgi:protein subunit release factor B